MFEKIEEFFENKILTLISGIFLLLELVPHIAEAFGAEFDPLGFLPVKLIWITIILSGTPLVINAVKKLIFKKGKLEEKLIFESSHKDIGKSLIFALTFSVRQ